MLRELLGSKTRVAVLEAIVEDPSQPLHLRELVRRAGTGVSGVQREVARLEEMGLIRSQEGPGKTREFVLQTEHPFADPLTGLIAAESRAAYAPCPVDAADTGLAPMLNPRIRGLAGAIADAARRAGATRVSLFGSATQADVAVVPADLDVAVTLAEEDAVTLAEEDAVTLAEEDAAPTAAAPRRAAAAATPDSRAERLFGLKTELERISGLPVDLVEPDAVDNPYLRAELERTEVVLYEAP